MTDKTKAYCKYCKCNIQCKLSDLILHANTKKHKAANKSQLLECKIPFKPISTKTQEQEAAIALYISKHSAIAPIDHLSSLCKNKFDDSVSCTQMKLHRTKCTNIIKKVLATHFVDDLRIDIGDSKFSLLLDESTDISATKLLDRFVYMNIANMYSKNSYLQVLLSDTSAKNSKK